MTETIDNTRLRRSRTNRDHGLTLAALLVLLAIGVLAWGPVFGGAPGWIAAGGGVLLGTVIAVVSHRRGWGLLRRATACLVAYLLFGGMLALPKTTLFGFVPTLDTLQRLAVLLYQSWRDLLTVSTPASNFTGPAVVPLLTGLVASVIAISVGLRTRYALWALLPVTAQLAIAIAWGVPRAPWATALGAAFAAVALGWASWLRQARTTRDPDGILKTDQRLSWVPRALRGVGVLLLATAVGVLAAPWPAAPERQVLRDTVDPPFDLRQYASPLMSYRYWEVDQKDATLFTVNGLPPGARLRLAALEKFDGNVYNVAASSAGFARAGQKMDGTAVGTPSRLDVTVGDYRGFWTPGAGEWRGVSFVGPQATRQLEGLYYNAYGATALTTSGISAGDAYSLQLVSPPAVNRDSLGAQPVASITQPDNTEVPDIVGRTAADWTGTLATPLEKAQRLEARLREGFYSNGSDGKSRPGHTSERIAGMLGAPILIGDDEQYAVAMALMAREIGLPARVVVGFYPDPQEATADTYQLTGDHAHVWVEICFRDAGWVTFDPTPDRDRIPQTELPQPQPNPEPMVLPPPDPPVADADEDSEPRLVNRKSDPRARNEWLPIVVTVLKVIGTAAVVASPFVAIALAKRRRRSLRRNAPDARDRAGGSWDEVMDAAIDLGLKTPKGSTRREEALALMAAYPTARAVPGTAKLIDGQVFGPAAPDERAVETAWTSGRDALREIQTTLNRRQRIIQFLSLRSFWRGRLPAGWLPGVPGRKPSATGPRPAAKEPKR